ncbi:MAG: glycosyltransferase family 9 protein [Deltaproteobacteria bacterium]
MNWKTEGLKRFDSIFGRLGCLVAKLMVNPRKESHNGDPRILVIRPGGIGDAALLYPALSELRKNFPGSRIDVLAEKRNGGILEGCPFISDLILYDYRPHETLYGVMKRHYDIVIDTEQWHRLTAALSYLTGASVRAGFETNERAELFTLPVKYSESDYEVLSFLNLISAVTGKNHEFDENEPFIPVDAGGDNALAQSISEFGKSKKAVAGMFTGATIRERRWGVEKFARLSGELSAEGIGTVIVGGGADERDALRFKEIAGNEHVLDFTGKTSLMETASIISLLNLFVTGDTGLMHVAYGVGTPTVSLFGAGIQGKWAPPGDNHIAINKRVPCSPCTKFGYTPPCPYHVRCLSEITVEEVRESVIELLSYSPVKSN